MKNILLLIPILLLTACNSKPLMDNPEQADKIIYQTQSYYNVAVAVETAYDKLPVCGESAIKICADAAIKKKVRKIDDAAYAAIREAQTAVRTPGFGEGKLTTVITTAKALTKAFTDITATLPKKD